MGLIVRRNLQHVLQAEQKLLHVEIARQQNHHQYLRLDTVQVHGQVGLLTDRRRVQHTVQKVVD